MLAESQRMAVHANVCEGRGLAVGGIGLTEMR